jgi:hypothetical protein
MRTPEIVDLQDISCVGIGFSRFVGGFKLRERHRFTKLNVITNLSLYKKTEFTKMSTMLRRYSWSSM